jgi:hypothetical protein
VSRRRYIGPQFWESEPATSVSVGARLLLVGCWTLADDEGLLRWEAPLIKDLLFNTDRDVNNSDVDGWMAQLVATGSVLPYTVSRPRSTLGYLIGFERGHKTGRPKASTLRAPDWSSPEALAALIARDGGQCSVCASAGTHPASDSPSPDPVTAWNSATLTSVGYPSQVSLAHSRCGLNAVDSGSFTHLPEGVREGLSKGSEIGLERRHLALAPEALSSTSEGPKSGGLEPRIGEIFSIARLTEPGNAALTTNSVSRAMPDSHTFSEPPSATKKQPLTCTNTDSLQVHRKLTEPSLHAHHILITHSPTEVEKEEEVEVEKEPLSASRSCVASGDARGAEIEVRIDTARPLAEHSTQTPKTPQQTSPTQPHTDDLSDADDVLTTTAPEPLPQGETPMPVDDSSEPLFDLSADMVQAPVDEIDAHNQPESWTEERKTEAARILQGWWAANGAKQPQSYAAIYRAVMYALTKGMVAKTIIKRLDEHVAADERIHPKSLGPKKPRSPEYATDNLKKQVTELLNPWWAMHGEGWPQTYAVVHRVLVSVLANKVKEEDIRTALIALAKTRKPISGGTIAFSLSKPDRQVAAEQAFAKAASSKTLDKYTQRTM